MTQDAVPADYQLIERLMEALLEENTAVVYARQLAKELEIDSLFVTITNTNDFAAAVAVGECNKKRNEKEEEEWSVL